MKNVLWWKWYSLGVMGFEGVPYTGSTAFSAQALINNTRQQREEHYAQKIAKEPNHLNIDDTFIDLLLEQPYHSGKRRYIAVKESYLSISSLCLYYSKWRQK